MRFERWEKDEFNGYLHSLRYICDKKGVDFFAITNECDLNRVQKLYNSDLHGSNYILSILWSEDFETDFSNLIEKNKSSSDRKIKNNEARNILYSQLKNARYNYCGIGTKNVKFALNDLSNEDINAKLMRIALEIEDCNISAKISENNLGKQKYIEKENLIHELIHICNMENINYGYKESDIPTVGSIIFFDLPCGQVSWHTNLDRDKNSMYNQEWDKKECSTLSKIEEYIEHNYSRVLEQYK